MAASLHCRSLRSSRGTRARRIHRVIAPRAGPVRRRWALDRMPAASRRPAAKAAQACRTRGLTSVSTPGPSTRLGAWATADQPNHRRQRTFKMRSSPTTARWDSTLHKKARATVSDRVPTARRTLRGTHRHPMRQRVIWPSLRRSPPALSTTDSAFSRLPWVATPTRGRAWAR